MSVTVRRRKEGALRSGRSSSTPCLCKAEASTLPLKDSGEDAKPWR